MASSQAIAQVQQNLPSWAATLPAVPWDSAKIGAMLDANYGNVLACVRLFWVQRVSDTQPLTDAHDANSTRPLSQDHENAIKMLQYWDNYIETSHTNRSNKIKRRYHNRRRGVLVGIDPFGYGSPYARTD